MNKILLLVLLLGLFLLADCFAQTQIWTAQDLDDIRLDLDGSYIQMADIDLAVFTNWVPIGTDNQPFTGSYDGNGFTIHSLSINTNNDNAGLFGVTDGALLDDLTLVIFFINARDNVGALVGYSIETEIANCSVFGSSIEGRNRVGGITGYNSGVTSTSIETCIVDSYISGVHKVGGIVGEFYRVYTASSYIVSCEFDGWVVAAGNQIGGIAGLFAGQGNHGSFIEECQASGLVSGLDYVGGIVGDFQGLQISTSYYYGDVEGEDAVGGVVGNLVSAVSESGFEGTVEGLNEVGGLVGRGGKYIADSYSVGEVIADGDKIGGLVGYFFMGGATIGNCYSESNVTALGNEVGGLVGRTEWSHSHITNSYAKGNVTGNNRVGGLIGDIYESTLLSATGPCYATGNVSGNNYVGGLVGYNDSSYWCLFHQETTYQDNVVRSFATGSVQGSENVGGLIGYTNGGDQIGLIDRNRLRDLYSTGSVTGSINVGGLIGRNDGAQISKSYSISLVNSGVAGNSIGGLIGTLSNDGEVDSSFWDVTASGQNDSAGGVGLMTHEMVWSDDLYDQWNFASIWEMIDFTTYPFFQATDGPILSNYPPHGYYKTYSGESYYWESFPVLWDRDQAGNQSGQEVVDPLTWNDDIYRVSDQNQTMVWNAPNWQGQPVEFNSTLGYLLSFVDLASYSLTVGRNGFSSTGIDFESYLELLAYPAASWVGYFIPQTQSVYTAFADIIDDLDVIKAEDWSMYRNPPDTGEWFHDEREPMVEYGKMYIVHPRPNVQQQVFQWGIPTEPLRREPLPETEFFAYNQQADYEAFFIESMVDEDDILEVAVYAGDNCVGASVFVGTYPLEVLAYTEGIPANEPISFAVHRSGSRGIAERISSFEVKDPQTGEFTHQQVMPRRNSYTIIRLGSGEFEFETILTPQIELYPNYPNPFVLSGTSRSNHTEIPFYVSEQREVTVTIYNIKGQLVRNLYSGTVVAGKHSVSWNGTNDYQREVGSGVYFYRLETGDKVVSRKMLLVR